MTIPMRRTKTPIQAAIMLTRNKTLKDLKTEMLLTFVSILLDDYKELKHKHSKPSKTPKRKWKNEIKEMG